MSQPDRDRFARLRAIYDELVDLPAEERRIRLQELGGEAEDLQEELAALLGDDTADRPSVLDRERALDDLAEAPLAAIEEGEPMPAGSRIGPYVVVRPLGEGGMGRVYEAEQREPLERRVAIKVLRPGVGSREVVSRFQAERRTLAVMEHPNIARMLEAGITAEERPWFAMELVDGVPITQWADERDLGLEARIGLMLPVCDAVQHSHLKGIVHRDLKPSNVLVCEGEQGQPVPKVIDFGIAKAVERPLLASTIATRFGELIGTPEYMSPEQAALGAVDVDTRSDVYALGLILYRLLAGELPPALRGLREIPFDEICRRIREEETPRPSSLLARTDRAGEPSTTPASYSSRRLRADLDAIVLQALAKDRERRYQSASALAADLRRFLHNEAVEAAPPSWRYRAGKFVRRHRAPVAFAALALVSLLGGLAVATSALIEARRSEREAIAAGERAEASRREALGALRTSEEASDFLVDLFRAADPRESRGLELTASELLERGLERIDALDSEPSVQVRLLESLGEVSWSLGAYDRAEPLLRRALELRRAEAPDARRQAQTLGRLGKLHRDRAELDEAAAVHREAVALLEKEGFAESVEMGGALNELAIVLRRQGKLDEATEALERSIVLAENLEEQPSSNLATSLANLGALRYTAGAPEASLEATRRSLAMFEELLPENHPDLATLYMNIGLVSRTVGRLGEARRSSLEALGISRHALPAGHPAIADVLHGLGSIEWRLGSLDAARAAFEEGLALLEEALGVGNFRTTLHRASLGSVALAGGDPAGALAHFDSVLADLAVSDDPRAGRHSIGYLRQRATALRRLGRVEAARAAVDRALRLAETEARGADVPVLQLQAALIELDRGRRAEAEVLFEQAIEGAGCEAAAPCALDAAATTVLRAHWHARRGETDAAFQVLALAVQHSDWTAWMLEAPDLDRLPKTDPRWQEAASELADRLDRVGGGTAQATRG